MSVSHKKVDATLQDQNTPIRALRFFKALGTLTLDGTATIGSRAVKVTNATGVLVGHVLCFKQSGRQLQVIVVSVAGAPTLTIDTPLDYAFTTAASVVYGTPAMNVDGSSTPVTFAVSAAPGTRIDVTQVRLALTDNADMDDGKFGGMTALTNGVVLQHYTPTAIYDVGNVKTNGDLKLTCSGEYASKAPSGSYGFTAICHFGGQENAGVVIRLNGTNGDEIRLIVQDNLTALTGAYALAIGHMVED